MVIANRRAFLEVADVSAQLRTLSWRMLKVQEDVQRSLARELHDDFGQIVTAIGTLIGRARRQLADGPALAGELDQVRGIAQQALDRIRSRSQWLHPGVLDDFGLQRALEVCVEQFQRQSGVRTHLATAGPIKSVRDDCAIHVYRVAQEALNNVARHSGATEAWVRLTCTGDRLVLEVEDRGRGIGAGAGPRDAGRGMGLVSMRERAELIGGSLHLHQPPEGGTTVRLQVENYLPIRRRRARGRLTCRSASSSPTTMRWCARASGASSTTRRTSPSSARPAAAPKPSSSIGSSIRTSSCSTCRCRRSTASTPRSRSCGARPDRQILILSMYDDAQYVRNALAAGVRGYILKNALEVDLIRAVRELAEGRRFLSPELTAAVERASAAEDGADDPFTQLSARELQVLRLVALGRSNKEIATLLGVSANTVAVHRTNLMARLGVHKAAELVLIAVRKGLVKPQ